MTHPTSHRLERGLFFCLLALLFWLPIPLGSHRPWAWALIEVWTFSLMGGWLWLNLRSQQPSSPQANLKNLRPYWPLLVIFALFTLWLGLQHLPLPMSWLKVLAPLASEHFLTNSLLTDNAQANTSTLSLDPNQTHVGFIKGLSYWCLLFLSLALVNTQARLKTLALTVVIAGTFQACYGVVLALSGSETTWVMGFNNTTIATGGFRYKNHFGNYLVLCLCLGIGLLIASLSEAKSSSLKEKLKDLVTMLLNGKAVVRLCLAMMVIGLVMSHSRMANTAFFASLSITGILGLVLIRKKNRSLTVLLVSLMIIDLMIVGSWFGVDKLKNRLENTSLMSETRDEVNQYGLSIIEQYPLAGTGGGSFYSSFPSVKGPGINILYDQAHNDYLQFAMEFGLPATLLLGAAVLWSLWHAFVALRSRRSSLMQGMAFAAVMAIMAELIMLTTDFHLQAPATAVYFMLCLGVAWKARYLER